LPASAYVSSGVPVIRGSNLSLGNVSFKGDEFVYVSEETAKRLERSLCEPEDIIFTKKGTLGQTGFVPTTHRYKKFLVSSNQMKLSVNRKIADPRFVYYYVSSPASREKIVRDSEVTGVPKTNLAYLRTFPIVLPPLDEQKAIAHILGTLDDKIELNQQMNHTLESIARVLFKSWFIDFDPVRAKMDGRQPVGMDAETAALFPDEFEDSAIGKIPKGWRVLTLGELGKVITGKTPSTKIPEYFGGGVPFITPSDMNGRKVIDETARYLTKGGVDVVKFALVPAGSIAVSCIGSDMGKVVYVARDSVTNQQINSVVVSKEFSNEYLYYNLSGRKFELQNLAGGGSAVPILNKAHFSLIKILIPNSTLLTIVRTVF
jgi:type I restriction enzyme S subunit